MFEPQYLGRDLFRNRVFARDHDKCVVCGRPAVDAHHIMERRLFDDGGYYLDNGVSLCAYDHLMAEKTLLPPDGLRMEAGITRVILPPHLYPDYLYDKWGNIMLPNGQRLKGELFYDESVQKILKEGGVLNLFSPYVKYPRTYHLPFSPGKTEDDKTLPDCSIFEGREVVVTIKMDGENTTGYADGYVHARSLDSGNHPSRNLVKKKLAEILFELPEGWRICGENLYAKHSIHYQNLEGYFYLFSIWNEQNRCLAWHEVEDWSFLLNIPMVPVIYQGVWDEQKVLDEYSKYNDGNEKEGFVVRLAGGFNYGEFRRSVAKFVRAEHVQTNKHWIKTAITPNELTEEARKHL